MPHPLADKRRRWTPRMGTVTLPPLNDACFQGLNEASSPSLAREG